MYKHLFFTVTLLATAMSPSFASAAPMSKVEYSAAKTRISADYKADQKLCTALKANAKDICSAEAKGKEKVALAELEFGYTGKPADGTKARVASAEAAYAIAKEKCDDLAGNDKDVCVKKAKAEEVAALAAAKLGKQVAAARWKPRKKCVTPTTSWRWKSATRLLVTPRPTAWRRPTRARQRRRPRPLRPWQR